MDAFWFARIVSSRASHSFVEVMLYPPHNPIATGSHVGRVWHRKQKPVFSVACKDVRWRHPLAFGRHAFRLHMHSLQASMLIV